MGRAVPHALRPTGVLCVERRPRHRLPEASAEYRRAAVAAAARRY